MPINSLAGWPAGKRLRYTLLQQVCAQSVPQTEREELRGLFFSNLPEPVLKNGDDEEPFNTGARHVISVFCFFFFRKSRFT